MMQAACIRVRQNADEPFLTRADRMNTEPAP